MVDPASPHDFDPTCIISCPAAPAPDSVVVVDLLLVDFSVGVLIVESPESTKPSSS